VVAQMTMRASAASVSSRAVGGSTPGTPRAQAIFADYNFIPIASPSEP
jgi:hypothetical protein